MKSILFYYQNNEQNKHDLCRPIVAHFWPDEQVAKVELPDHHRQSAHDAGDGVRKVFNIIGQDVEAQRKGNQAEKYKKKVND